MDTSRKIIHIDMDAFYASVEQRDHPEFRGSHLLLVETLINAELLRLVLMKRANSVCIQLCPPGKLLNFVRTVFLFTAIWLIM